MNGNYYAIDIWGLIAALVMVVIAAGISETMRMGRGAHASVVGLPCTAAIVRDGLHHGVRHPFEQSVAGAAACGVHAHRGRADHLRVRKVCRRAWLDRCS